MNDNDPLKTISSAQPGAGGSGPVSSDGPASGSLSLQAGQIIAARYRIVSSLGRGGMGEVYRADDLTLGVPVALKFLPGSRSADPAWLMRFRSEVRLARSVSHPNVCRVYDIAEADGRAFLAMEFIDGEDLASVRRRFGRLPSERAVEIARQLCLGLAAIHEQGVIHRDLKPANVMLDGRGRVRVTDFGIAFSAAQSTLKGEIAGTPLYMAPEQLNGGEVTVRSDIYSLGLILYELFTGKPALSLGETATLADLKKLHASDTRPTSLSTFAPDIHPAAERIILRCLDKDPTERPKNAVVVVAALPGGDPLAAALAAGETPSPELVAATGERGVISRKTATALAAVSLLAVVLFVWLSMLIQAANPGLAFAKSKPPAVLDDRAREIVRALVPEVPDADEWTAIAIRAGRYNDPPDGPASARDGGPTLVYVARYSPVTFAYSPLRFTSLWHPTPFPGDVVIEVSSEEAKLRYLRVVSTGKPPGSPPTSVPDTTAAALRFAGIDAADLSPAEPSYCPPLVGFDQRVAFTASAAAPHGLPESANRLELGFRNGRLTSFVLLEKPAITEPVAPAASTTEPSNPTETVGAPVVVKAIRWLGRMFFTALTRSIDVAFIAAWIIGGYNLAKRRADRRGTMRIALFLTAATSLRFLTSAHFSPGLPGLIGQLFSGLGDGAARACTCAMTYAALEPMIRRTWPTLLTSWTRVLDGRWRDPLIGRDILFATSVLLPGVAIGLLGLAISSRSDVSDGAPLVALPVGLVAGISVFTRAVINAVAGPLLGCFLVAGMLRLFKRRWPAFLALWAFATLLSVQVSPRLEPAMVFFVAVTIGLTVAGLLCRFGLLAYGVYLLIALATNSLMISPALGSWYTTAALPGFAVWLALIAFGWWTSQGWGHAAGTNAPVASESAKPVPA